MSRYIDRIAKKNKQQYTIIEKLFLGDMSTSIENTGNGTYKICSPSSQITINKNGNIDISGSQSVTLGGKNLDFHELPDRYIRPSGISWNWIATNTEVFGVIPIRIKGHKVYIPFINLEV